jgi:hypothetical protein
MLNENVYNSGYSCGYCSSYICNIITCDCGCGYYCFNVGRCLYDICVHICCNITCDFEYCLIYFSGWYDGYNNNNTTESSIHINISTNDVIV